MAFVVSFLASALTLGGPAAGSDLDNFVLSNSENGGDLGFYDYGSGTPLGAPADTDWTDGDFYGTTSSLLPGSLTLANGTAVVDPATLRADNNPDLAWWDGAWTGRHCVGIDHTAAGASTLTDYQVRITLDTQALIAAGLFDADGADLRAIRQDNTPTFVAQDLWIEDWSINIDETWVWVQVDTISAGTTTDLCLYYANPAFLVPSVSDPETVFTYSAPLPLYYTVTDAYTALAGTTQVSPYFDATTVIHDGGAPVGLGATDVAAFTGNNADSVYEVDGPIAGVGIRNVQDTLVPVSAAGTEFVVPTAASTQRWHIRSPWGTANVEILNGSTSLGTTSVAPGDGTVTVVGDVTGTRTGIVRSTNGVPFLLTHTSTVPGDSIVAWPSTTLDQFGVQSANQRIGYSTNGSDATTVRSDGTQDTVTSQGPDAATSYGGGGLGGGPPAARVTGLNNRVGVIQQGDGDGDESTSFWTLDELASEYLLPSASRYIAVACPLTGTTIVINGGAPIPCAGTTFAQGFIGHAVQTVGIPVLPGAGAATTVASSAGEPFYLYFEQRVEDETQVTSLKQARQFAYPAPEVRLYGSWESAAIDTGTDGVYGLINWSLLPGLTTTTRFQVASGPDQASAEAATPVGPDDTDTTYYMTSEPLAYDHDLDRWARIVVEMTSLDPLGSAVLSSVTIDTDLGAWSAAVGTPTVVAIASPAGVDTTTWVARVRSAAANLSASPATIRNNGPPALPNLESATVRFYRPDSDQVIVADLGAGGEITQATGAPVTFSTNDPHSIVVDSRTYSGTTDLDVIWSVEVNTSSPVLEHDFRIRIAA